MAKPTCNKCNGSNLEFLRLFVLQGKLTGAYNCFTCNQQVNYTPEYINGEKNG